MADMPIETIRRIRHSGRVEALEEVRENTMKIAKRKGNDLVIDIREFSALVNALEQK